MVEPKVTKPKNKKAIKFASVRITAESQKVAYDFLDEANAKDGGGAIKFYQLIALSLSLVKSEHLEMLQKRSLKNSDRQELLRKKYAELHGLVTQEEFIGVTMTPAYFDFLKEHGYLVDVA